jgi:hypothetical protein
VPFLRWSSAAPAVSPDSGQKGRTPVRTENSKSLGPLPKPTSERTDPCARIPQRNQKLTYVMPIICWRFKGSAKICPVRFWQTSLTRPNNPSLLPYSKTVFTAAGLPKPVSLW